MKETEVKLGVADILEGFEFQSHYEKYFKAALGIDEPVGIMINNKSKLISDAEIRSVLDLLHSDYRELDASIDIHGRRLHTLLQMTKLSHLGSHKSLMEGYRGEIGGYQSGNRVVLFSHLYGRRTRNEKYRIECFKLLLVGSILHEIRHVWQMVHKKKKYKTAARNYIDASGDGYDSQWIERDANNFTQRVMNNNKSEINEILGIEFEWDCAWGSFRLFEDK